MILLGLSFQGQWERCPFAYGNECSKNASLASKAEFVKHSQCRNLIFQS